MAIRTFNSVGGFSYGEDATVVISTDGNISNVASAVIGNITASTQITAGNVTSNNLTNTQVTFTNNGVLSDSSNFTFTNGNLLTIIDAANITDGTNYVSITGGNGGITTSGNVSFADGAMTVNTDGDVAVANSFTVGANGANGDSAFYVDAAGNFSIKIANTADTANGGFTTVFQVDAASGNITTAGSVVSPGGGAATITAPGANTQILFNDGGDVGANSQLTFDKDSVTLSVDGNIQLLDNTSGYLVLPQGGYLYDSGSSNSAVLHAANGGYSQLEYVDDGGNGPNSYVWVNSNQASMEFDGTSTVVVDGDGTKISTNGGGVYFYANTNGNAYIGSNGSQWIFDADNNLSAPGSIYANTTGVGVYVPDGEVSSYSLNVTDTANINGDALIHGSLTVEGGSESYLTGNVIVGTIGDYDANVGISNNLHVYNDANVDGALTIGNLNVTNYVVSNLVPGTDADGSGAGYDLGNSTHRWRDLWLSGLTINLGNTTISSGGSNNMIVGNAIIGYAGALTGYTSPSVGNLYAGYLTVSNTAAIGNSTARANLAVSGNLTVDDATDATSTTSGSFQVKGGVGIGGNIYVGGATANITGNVLISGAEANIDTGNLRVGGNANIIADLVIGGNLTVSGTTTYVNTTNSSIKDALIDIAGGDNGADLGASDAYDRGLYIHNYDGGVSNQFMGWKQGSSEFQLLTNATTTAGSNQVNGDLANLSVDHLFGTIGTTTQDEITDMGGLVNITVSGNANVTGTANINTAILSDLTLGELHFTNLDVNGPLDNEVVVLRTDGAGEVSFEIIHTDRIGNVSSGIFVNADGNVEITANGNLSMTVTESGANVVGTFDVTGELSAGSLTVGSLSPESIALGDTTIQDQTSTTSATTANQVIAEVAAVDGTVAEFFVKGLVTNGGVKKITAATITATYDGTSVDFATYGKINMGSGGAGSALKVTYAGSKLQLQVTPTYADSTVWTTQIRTI